MSTASGPKRVVIATETFEPEIGGGETQARTLTDALTARGYAVTLVTRRSRPHLPAREQQQQLEIVRVPPIGPGRWKKWGLLVTSFPALLTAARHADAVMVSGFRILGAAAVLATRLRRTPLFLKGDNRGELSGDYFRAGLARFHLTPRSPPVRFFLGLRNLALRRAEGFVALSEEMATEYAASGVPSARLHRIPNGVDVERFQPADPEEKLDLRRRLGFPNGKVVLFTGRLVSHKGLPELLRAWERLHLEGVTATLYLVGEGGADMHACETELREFVRERQLESSVRFTGPVTNVVDYLGAADAFVFPSRDDGLPLSLVEAMSCALPVVSTLVGGMRDFLVDGRNGYVVPMGDEDALVNVLRRVIAGGPEVEAVGRAGRDTVVARFSHHAVTDQWVQLFESTRRSIGAPT
jgi:glycosyltransferase involved in cell wall biosynthesis